MGSQPFEKTRDVAGRSFGKMTTDVFVPKSTNGMLSTDQDLEELLIVGGKEVESLVDSSLHSFGRGNLFQVFHSRAGIIQFRDELQVSTVCIGHEFDQIGQTVDGLLELGELEDLSTVALFHHAVVLEKRDIIGRGLDAKDQGEFVVHLDRDRSHMVANPCLGFVC